MADNDDYDDISVEEMDAIDAEVMRGKSLHRPAIHTLPELMIRLALMPAHVARLRRDRTTSMVIEAQAWLLEVMDDRTDDLPVVDFVATHLGWPDEFFIHPDFAKASVLPPVGDFNGLNDGEKFVTHVRHYAVVGAGTGGELVRKQQERGPRWGRT